MCSKNALHAGEVSGSRADPVRRGDARSLLRGMAVPDRDAEPVRGAGCTT